jgi:7,8-didemethyl-8-hydroxy-5-deazariboflavin synthase CofG subunit
LNLLESSRDFVADPLQRDEALQLMNLPLDSLEPLLKPAGQLRDRLKGRVLTYSPKAFLPITNLCRDRCSYCTFRRSPNDPKAKTMTLEEVDQVSRTAAQRGCIEALMCLGDKPEAVYPSYREQLRAVGAETTVDYVVMSCEAALAAGLLPHTNAGLLSKSEMARLRPLNVSMGLMLENISPRLREKGQAHAAAPGKDPQLRLEMIRQAGELDIPFTSGVLMGIGETTTELIDSLLALRDVHNEFGHIQEIIVQSFRSKPDTPMRDWIDPNDQQLAQVLAIARLMMPYMNLQAPPNLSPKGHALLIRSGINDWGGISPVTADFINPEAPWPQIEALAANCGELGYQLRARLPVYSEYYSTAERKQRYIDSALHQPLETMEARLQHALST